MAGKPKSPELLQNRLKITAKPAAGFWRAGIFHPAEAVEHEGGKFTLAQAHQLVDEPLLVVEDLGADQPAA
jgi:hypothetical protein